MSHSWRLLFYVLLTFVFTWVFLYLTPSQPLPLKTVDYSLDNYQYYSQFSKRSVFEDQTAYSGLLVSHLQGGDKITNLVETLGAGACVLDYNNDGWLDIFFITGSGQTRFYGRREWWQKGHSNVLYQNNTNGQFVDVTEKVGLKNNVWGMGCVSADFDNDGDEDLFITTYGKNILYENRGGHFTNITKIAGISGDAWSTSAIVADYNLDGLLDLYVVNYLDFKNGSKTYEKTSGFQRLLPVGFDSRMYDGQANQLYLNKGNLKFEDVTHGVGVADEGGRGLSAQWVDLNKDQYPDLIISNDAGLPNAVFLNKQGKKFSNATQAFPLNSANATTAVAVADINGDGKTDFVYNTYSTDPLQLFIADQNLQLNEVSRQWRLNEGANNERYGWGIGLADFDNNGWVDLFSGNGMIVRDMDNQKLSQGQIDSLWFNNGESGFITCRENCSKVLMSKFSSRAVILFDFDNDGDIDNLVTHNNDSPQLFVNQTHTERLGQSKTNRKANWLGIKLVGSSDNRDAIGSKVIVTTKDRKQIKFNDNGAGFLSSADKRLHFGLSDEKLVQSINVIWPDGSTQILNNIAVNQYIKIQQAKAGFKEISYPKVSYKASHEFSWFNKIENDIDRFYLLTVLEKAKIGLNFTGQILEFAYTSDKKTRLTIAEYYAKHVSHIGLRLLVQLLSDAEPEIRLAAIKGLRNYESEFAIRPLIELFSDKDAGILCGLSEAFSFYFQEEEAVVNRKYLALPGLINILSDSRDKVKICAAEALGESEKYRAVSPLLQQLTKVKGDVKISVLTALGLLRDRKALPDVRDIFLNASEHERVRAYALVAMKRMADNDLLNEVKLSLNQYTLSTLKTLNILVNESDFGVVISREMITRTVLEWLDQMLKEGVTTENEGSVLLALDILKQIDDASALPIIKKMTTLNIKSIRQKSIALYMEKDEDYFINNINDFLAEGSKSLNRIILNVANKQNYSLSFKDRQRLMQDESLHYLVIMNDISSKDHESLKKISQYLENDTLKETELVTVLHSLQKNKLFELSISEQMLRHENPDIRLAARTYSYNKILSEGHENEAHAIIEKALADTNEKNKSWAVGQLFVENRLWYRRKWEQMLMDTQQKFDIRLMLLSHLSSVKPVIAKTKILALVRNPDDEIWLPAINMLEKLADNDVLNKLQGFLDNKQYSDRQRIKILDILITKRRQYVLSWLRKYGK